MRFEKLEAIRGFAAMYVVVYHLLMKVNLKIHGIDILLPFRFGQEAVILFFLLSGFVIKYSFEVSKNKSFYNYFFKRFTRIYIPLFFVFIISYILKSIEAGSIISADLRTLLGNIFMLQDVNIKPNILVSTYMGNTPLWSLSYEWWFYILFYVFYKSIPAKYSQLAIAIVVLLNGFYYIYHPFIINRILFYFGIWWIGVELAKLYLIKKNIRFISLSYSFFLLFSCIIICILNYVVNAKKYHPTFGTSPILELRHFVFTFIILFISVLWYRFKWIGFNSIFSIFVKVTPISYTIYIAHWPLLIDRSYLSFLHNNLSELVVAMLLTALFSIAIEIGIYPKIRNFLSRNLSRL